MNDREKLIAEIECLRLDIDDPTFPRMKIYMEKSVSMERLTKLQKVYTMIVESDFSEFDSVLHDLDIFFDKVDQGKILISFEGGIIL